MSGASVENICITTKILLQIDYYNTIHGMIATRNEITTNTIGPRLKPCTFYMPLRIGLDVIFLLSSALVPNTEGESYCRDWFWPFGME